jgi:hypothetical protein
MLRMRISGTSRPSARSTRSVLKYRRLGIEVAVIGVNEASAHMLDRFALHDKEHAAFLASAGH